MGTRSNLWDNVETELEQGQKPATAVIATVNPKLNMKVKPIQSTLYLAPQVHRQLKEMAFAQDCKMHDLFIEGINHVLAGKGYGTVEELSKK